MLSMKVNSKLQDCALKIILEYVEKNVITSEKFDETYPNTYDLKVIDVEITQVLIDSLKQDKAMNFLKSNKTINTELNCAKKSVQNYVTRN